MISNKMSIDKNKKILVLDTNVAIDDPECLEKFGDNNLVIPIAVYEELNDIKGESHTERGFLAREFLRNLTKIQRDALNLENDCSGNNFREGIKFGETNIFLDVNREYDLEGFYFDLNKNDNKIVYCAYKLKQEYDNVVIVSNDVGVRFAAIEQNIPAEEYKANRIDKKELYTGYKEVLVSSELIDKFYKEKKLENSFELYPNEFVILVDENNMERKAVGRCKKDKNTGREQIYILNENKTQKSNLDSCPKIIRPKNLGQKMFYDLLQDDDVKIITVTGMPGVGKTLIPIADALEKVEDNKYKKLLYCKSVIPTDKEEEIGYFKGDMIDKLSHHLQGLYTSIEFLYEKEIYNSKNKKQLNDIVDKLISTNLIELKPLATIRGASIQNRYIIFDEAQNVNNYMMKAIITRICEDCKIVIAGDLNQIDTKHLHKYNNGLAHLIAKGKKENYIAHISLDINGKSVRGDIATFGNKL